jgi:hypothetical protein
VAENDFSACVVYWLKDKHCICPWRHGYVGITNNPLLRIRNHRGSHRFPSNFQFQILFAGNELECLGLERRLRPIPGIGWNIASGGLDGSHPWTEKQHKWVKTRKASPKTKELMRRAAIERSKDPAYIARMAEGVRRAFQDPQKRANLSNSLKGRSITWADKIAKTLTGHVRTEASRAKQSAKMRGVPKSAEQRAKMAEGRRQWWAKKTAEERAAYAAHMSEVQKMRDDPSKG